MMANTVQKKIRINYDGLIVKLLCVNVIQQQSSNLAIKPSKYQAKITHGNNLKYKAFYTTPYKL